jgi:STE24 endopeptidase
VQVTVILAVLLALLVGESATELPVWLNGLEGLNCPAMMAGSILLLWAFSRLSAKVLLGRLERAGQSVRSVLRLPGKIDIMMQVMILSLFAVQLTIGGWGRLVYVRWQLGKLILIDELLIIAPFIVMLIIKWYFFYPVNRFIKEYIVAGQLAGGISTRPVWSRRQYISFNIRHHILIILGPLFLILTYKDIVELVARYLVGGGAGDAKFSPETDLMVQAIVIAGGGAIFICAPMLLRRIWLTRSLPDGPLRRRLEDFCKQMGFKYRDILLWETYSAVSNAAVMGLVWPLRYVLLSDALIENMSDEQIEAVFGHEAGHVKHHHIMLLIFFIMGSGSLMVLLLELLAWVITGSGGQDYWGQWIVYGGVPVAVFVWFMLFGWVSRRFERQADVYGAWAAGKSGEENNSQAEDADNADNKEAGQCGVGRRVLNSRGVAIMIAALGRIALLNGIPIETRSWRHSSIASRMSLLAQLFERKDKLKQFERGIRLIQVLSIIMPMIAMLGWWWLSDRQH